MDISPLLLSTGHSCHSICMVFSDEQIEQFQQIYFNRYGKEISKEIAKEQASKLLQLLILIYKPMSIKEFEAIQKKRLESLPEIAMCHQNKYIPHHVNSKLSHMQLDQ